MNTSNFKPLVVLLMALVFLPPASAATLAKDKRIVQVDIGGIGPAVDQAALSTVRQVIGFAVANGVADKFIVPDYAGTPIEGGLSACVQASPTTTAFGAFVNQLRSIKPNPKTTAYSVRHVSACPEPVVICTQDAKRCPDGSYVSRMAPSCAFAACPLK